MKDLDGRIAVVTGAGSGIGRALARAFGRERMKVLVLDVDPDGLAETVAMVRSGGGIAEPRILDVCDPRGTEEAAGAAFALGDVAVLCNNAGVGTPPIRPLWETPLRDWDWIFDVNVMGVVHGIRAFVPRMLAAGRPAYIVNTASMAGLYSPPFLGPYVASKHAVVGLSEQLLRELRAVNADVGVSVLCPLFVNTRILDGERNRPTKYAVDNVPLDASLADRLRASLAGGQSPDDVAALVLHAIAENRFMILCNETSAEMARERLAILDGRSPVDDTTILATEA